MKYKAVIETDDFENFEFFEDGCGKYIHGIDAGAVNNEWIPLYFTECEQEPVLNKIKAEIDQKQYDFMSDGDYNEGIRFGLMLAYQIIDKYRAERSGEE